MEYLIGIVLAVLIGAAARFTGFEKDKSFYPTILMAIATFYVVFAVMAGSSEFIWSELLIAGVFFVVAVIGFQKSLWVIVFGLIAHAVFDYSHTLVIGNPAVPAWWPGFCLAVDATLGIWLAGLLWLHPDGMPEQQ